MTTTSTDSHIFADTGAWYALADQSDNHHADAVAVYTQLLQTCSLLTTNLVIAETYTLIRRALGHVKLHAQFGGQTIHNHGQRR